MKDKKSSRVYFTKDGLLVKSKEVTSLPMYAFFTPMKLL